MLRRMHHGAVLPVPQLCPSCTPALGYLPVTGCQPFTVASMETLTEAPQATECQHLLPMHDRNSQSSFPLLPMNYTHSPHVPGSTQHNLHTMVRSTGSLSILSLFLADMLLPCIPCVCVDTAHEMQCGTCFQRVLEGTEGCIGTPSRENLCSLTACLACTKSFSCMYAVGYW